MAVQVSIQAPHKSSYMENDREKLNFLMEQFQKYESEETSRLDFIKLIGFRFSAQNDLWCRLFRSLQYILNDKNILSMYMYIFFISHSMIPFSKPTSTSLWQAGGNTVNLLYISTYGA